jgi:hypothetical protein
VAVTPGGYDLHQAALPPAVRAGVTGGDRLAAVDHQHLEAPMPTLTRFDPPGLLDEFDRIPGQRAGWDRYISSTFSGAIARVRGQGVPAAEVQFYDETQTASEEPIVDEAIQWLGFPQTLVARFGRSRALRMADEPAPDSQIGGILSRIQDEYLEWLVTREGTRIKRVTFTCEGPEYWQSIAGGPSIYDPAGKSPADFGAQGDPDVLVDLYRQILGTNEVEPEDLFFPDAPDTYNPWNVWNTQRGIVHLQQINNTLGAEITIGADGTVLRDKGGPVTDATRLICCGGFGGPERASDPHLGAAVNALARQGFALTLRNPVGIYMAGIDDTAVTQPKAGGGREPADDYFRVVRPQPTAANEGLAVRAVYEVPEGVLNPDGSQMTVSDLQIAGVPITFGGQLAEKVTMQFFARACREGAFDSTPQPCSAKCCRQGGVLDIVSLGDPCVDVFPVVQPPVPVMPRADEVRSMIARGRSRGGNVG